MLRFQWPAGGGPRAIDVGALTPEQIDIEHIAHILARRPRWGGAFGKGFYSVAQHCVQMAQTMLWKDAEPLWAPFISQAREHTNTVLWALLHDAAEAYLLDAPRIVRERLVIIDDLAPLDLTSCDPEDWQMLSEIEARVLGIIMERFGLPAAMPDCVRRLDDMANEVELKVMSGRRDELTPTERIWFRQLLGINLDFRYWERAYLATFEELMVAREAANEHGEKKGEDDGETQDRAPAGG